MSDIVSSSNVSNLVFGTFLPILLGVFGYFLASFWMKPVIAFRELKEKIFADLIYFTDVIHNPGLGTDKQDQASESLRRHAADLRAINNTLVSFEIFRSIMRTPKKEDLNEAGSHLIGMSNSVFREKDLVGYDDVALYTRIKVIQESLDIVIDENIDSMLKLAKSAVSRVTGSEG